MHGFVLEGFSCKVSCKAGPSRRSSKRAGILSSFFLRSLLKRSRGWAEVGLGNGIPSSRAMLLHEERKPFPRLMVSYIATLWYRSSFHCCLHKYRDLLSRNSEMQGKKILYSDPRDSFVFLGRIICQFGGVIQPIFR